MAGLFSDNFPQTAPDTSFFQNAPQPQLPQNVLPQSPLPITDAQKIPYWQDIILAKKGYGVAEQNLLQLNQLLDNPDLTDDDKQKINDKITLNNEAMAGFSKYADSVRNTANTLGLDMSNYGNDKTLAESTQALNNYAATAVRDLFAMPSVAEQEQARFDELLARGVRPSQAHRLINFDRPKVQGEYERRLGDGIMAYGLNSDGSLNGIGISLMQHALSSSPQTAQLFGTAFALPKNIFDETNANDRARLAAEAQSGLLGQRLAAQAELARLQEEAKRQNLELTLQNKTDIENAKEAGRNARATAQLIQNSPAGKFASYYELGLQIYGGDEKQAMQYAYRETSKWKPDKPEVSAAQGVFNLFDTMFSYIAQGDEDSAGHLLEKVITNQNDKAEEFGAKFTPEENQKINDLRSAFINYLKLEPTSTDPKEINKQKAAALKTLMAKYRAINRGTNWTDEFAALSQSSFNARRNGKENSATGYDDYDQANKRVRELLGDNNGNKPWIPYTPPPVSGTGYYGGYVPQVRYP